MIYEILKVGKSVGSLDDPLFDTFSYYAEEKVDGIGAMLVWDDDGQLLALTPQRNVTGCFPKEIQVMPTLAGWILHVEVMAGQTSTDVATFLSKKGWKSALEPGIVVLDCLRAGSDVRDLPFVRRRSHAALATVELRRVAPDGLTVRQPEWSMMTKREFAKRIIGDGGEGIVLKNVNEDYYATQIKYKVVHGADAAVRSYRPGQGKYEGSLGALVLELRRGGVWVQIGTCSGKCRRAALPFQSCAG